MADRKPSTRCGDNVRSLLLSMPPGFRASLGNMLDTAIIENYGKPDFALDGELFAALLFDIAAADKELATGGADEHPFDTLP